MAIVDMLLPEYDQEMANTRRMLAAVPEDRFSYKPHAKSWSLGQLATHLSQIPSWIVETIEKDELDIAPPGQPPYRAEERNSPKEVLDAFDAAVAKGREALKASTDEKLMQPWALLQGGNVMFKMPRLTVLRSFVMNHSIHHRAQLGVYLRLVDAKVPGMYGPTADDAAFAG